MVQGVQRQLRSPASASKIPPRRSSVTYLSAPRYPVESSHGPRNNTRNVNIAPTLITSLIYGHYYKRPISNDRVFRKTVIYYIDETVCNARVVTVLSRQRSELLSIHITGNVINGPQRHDSAPRAERAGTFAVHVFQRPARVRGCS